MMKDFIPDEPMIAVSLVLAICWVVVALAAVWLL